MIDAQTQIYGILGHPLGHTRSPNLHNRAFEEAGINAIYCAFEVVPESLSDAIKGFRALNLRGANVTIPHKVAVIPHLDGLTPLAKRIGAVNTLFWEGEKLLGDNTDAPGFSSTLPDSCKGKALILGGGGAARAVAVALVDRGLDVSLAMRTPQPVEGVRVVSFNDTENLLSGVDLLVNATPVGLDEKSPLESRLIALLPSHTLVYDLIYRETPLLRMAKERGLPTRDGGLMLARQAALSFQRWTGREMAGFFEGAMGISGQWSVVSGQ